MTIANSTNKSGPYFYNGSATTFAYGFKIDDATHIHVVETVIATGVETDLVLTSDYTVTGVGADTGNVVITPARAAGKSVTLVRKVPFTQTTVLENQGAYFAKVVEGALDRSVARDQQLQEQISRAVVVPVSADPTDLAALIGGVVALLDNVDAVVAVAAIAPSVEIVAADGVDIGVVAGSIAAVQTAAANIAAIIAAPANATATAADRVQTGLDRVATAADRVQTGLDKVATAADRVVTTADRVVTTADKVATAADRVVTGQDRVQTGLDRAAAAASAASVNAAIISMSRRRNMSVNGSLLVSQENGDTLGTANGYFYADQKALYRSADLAGKISAQRVAYTSLAGGSKAGEFKCVTVAALISTSFAVDTDFVEGSDPEFVAAGWGAAGAKPYMYRLECGNVPAGTYSLHVTNRAGNRHVWVPVVISGADAITRVVKEISIPGDTGGTWSKADGEIGATIDFVFVLGSSFVGGTAGVWSASAFYGGAGQKNFLDNTANVARHTDFGMRLDPDATGVYGAYEVGEVDAKFRSERYLRQFVNDSGAEYFYLLLYNAEANGISTGITSFPVRMSKKPIVSAGTINLLNTAAATFVVTTDGFQMTAAAIAPGRVGLSVVSGARLAFFIARLS